MCGGNDSVATAGRPGRGQVIPEAICDRGQARGVPAFNLTVLLESEMRRTCEMLDTERNVSQLSLIIFSFEINSSVERWTSVF